MWKLINKNEGWPQGPSVRRMWGPSRKHPSTERHDTRHSAAQHPLTDLEINYACFHITIQLPLWGTLTPSTPYTLVFLRPPPHPPTHCSPRQGNGQDTVTQSCLLLLHENYRTADCSIYSSDTMSRSLRIRILVIGYHLTQHPFSHLCNHTCNAGAGAGTVFSLAFPA